MTRLQLAIVGVLLVAAAIAGGYVKDWWRGNPEPTRQPTVEKKDRPMKEDDTPGASTPSKEERYEAPDSSETTTRCNEIPTWMLTSSSEPATDSARSERGETPGESASKKTSRPQRRTTKPAGPGYRIIPTEQGRPRISVGSRQVTLSTTHPWTGAGTTYTYPVPTWDWRLTAQVKTAASHSYATGHAAVMLEHNLEIGRISVGPSYGAAITADGYRAGPGITVSFETTLWSDE